LPPERRRAKLKLNPAKRTWAQAGRVRLSVTFRRTNSVAWCRDMAAAMFSVCIFGFSRCRPSVRRARSVAEMSQFASRARVGGRGVAPWPGDLASRFLFSAPARAMSCPRRVVWLKCRNSQAGRPFGWRGVARRPGDLASCFLFSAPARAPSCPRREVWPKGRISQVDQRQGAAQSSSVAPRMRCGPEATFRRTAPAEPDATLGGPRNPCENADARLPNRPD
jgi:hypothetical protein